MSLRYRYKLARAKGPVVTLGGRWARPYPLVAVTLIGPADSRPVVGLLDTGADDTVFPERLANQLGIDLTNAPAGEAAGVGTFPVPVRYAEVTMRIASGAERREWRAWVGFAKTKLHRPLLGFAGFLRYFSANFMGDREEVELAVNSLYPGS